MRGRFLIGVKNDYNAYLFSWILVYFKIIIDGTSIFMLTEYEKLNPELTIMNWSLLITYIVIMAIFNCLMCMFLHKGKVYLY